MGRPPKQNVSEGSNKVEKEIDDITVRLMDEPVMTQGSWKKVNSMVEVADLEAKGKLKGFKPNTMEVLCSESMDF